MARFGHRFGSIASVLTLVGGMLLVPVPRVAAATCEVTNTGSGTTYGALQDAVDASASGDTLEVRGTCVGQAGIHQTRLVLKGVPTTEQPTPTLDGGGVGRVLRVRKASVVLRDLTITNGKAPHDGGGVEIAGGRLALRGSTSVTENDARFGGGISNYGTLTLNDSSSVTGNAARGSSGGIYNYGTLTLNDSSSVTGNGAWNAGGGIFNEYGTLTLNDSSSVTGNTAGIGGGIYNYGTLTLNDSSSVSGNTAVGSGGIFSGGGTLTLNDSSSVTGNEAWDEGGGIYDHRSRVYVCSDEVAISPNDPDDPPKVRQVCP